MRNPRLVCIGDLMLDVVVRAGAQLEPGSDTPGTVRFRLGGSAGNTCRAFVALGGRASLVCAVGDDGLGRLLISAHRAEGVTVHAVRVRGRTPRLVAHVASDGERSFVTDRGVADSLPPSALNPRWFGRGNILHVPAYSLLTSPLCDASAVAASLAGRGGGSVSLDLASRAPLLAAGPEWLRAVCGVVHPTFIFANRDEVVAVVGSDDPRPLLELTGVVVVKLGADGCRVLWHEPRGRGAMEIEVATKAIRAADTTGAGDAFAAGFLYGFFDTTPSRPFSQILRHAGLTGHHAAARALSRPRPELVL